MRNCSTACHHRIGNSRRLHRRPHRMHPDNRSSMQNRRHHRRNAGRLARIRRSVHAPMQRSQRPPQKRLPAHPHQQRPAQVQQPLLPRQQRIVFLKALAKSIARIENNPLRPNARFPRCRETLFQPRAHLEQHLIATGPRQRPPLLRPPPRMHQHHAAPGLRTHRGHLRIPRKAAHIVHNLRACLQGRPRRRRLVGIH